VLDNGRVAVKWKIGYSTNMVNQLGYSKLLKKAHENKWVAISPSYKKLLAVGETLSEVLQKTGKKEVVVMQVMPDTGYAPALR